MTKGVRANLLVVGDLSSLDAGLNLEGKREGAINLVNESLIRRWIELELVRDVAPVHSTLKSFDVTAHIRLVFQQVP